MIRIILTEENFADLVKGNVLSVQTPQGLVQICLQDIGFTTMHCAIIAAEGMPDAGDEENNSDDL